MNKVTFIFFLVALPFQYIYTESSCGENESQVYKPGTLQKRKVQTSSLSKVEVLQNRIIELENTKPFNWRNKVLVLKKDLIKRRPVKAEAVLR